MEQVPMLEQWAYFTHFSVLSHPTPRPGPKKRQQGPDRGVRGGDREGIEGQVEASHCQEDCLLPCLAIQAAPFSDSKDGHGKNLTRGLPSISPGCLTRLVLYCFVAVF